MAGSLFLLFLLGLELVDRLTMKRDLEIAREIQGWLVPKTPPRVEGLDIAFVTRPANTVSGDYYDAFLRPAPGGTSTGQHLLVGVADVAGKSVPAALLMATFQASLHSLAADDLPLPELIVRLNRYASAHSFGGLRVTTAFMANIELDVRILTYVGASHNAPFLMSMNGGVERLVTGGLRLGIEPAAVYETGKVSLHTGDRLVVFSDGLVESHNRREEEYGEERLLQMVRSTAGLSAQEELDRILESVDEFVGGAPRPAMTIRRVSSCIFPTERLLSRQSVRVTSSFKARALRASAGGWIGADEAFTRDRIRGKAAISHVTGIDVPPHLRVPTAFTTSTSKTWSIGAGTGGGAAGAPRGAERGAPRFSMLTISPLALPGAPLSGGRSRAAEEPTGAECIWLPQPLETGIPLH